MIDEFEKIKAAEESAGSREPYGAITGLETVFTTTDRRRCRC